MPPASLLRWHGYPHVGVTAKMLELWSLGLHPPPLQKNAAGARALALWPWHSRADLQRRLQYKHFAASRAASVGVSGCAEREDASVILATLSATSSHILPLHAELSAMLAINKRTVIELTLAETSV